MNSMTPIEQRESGLDRYHVAFDNALYSAAARHR
jgi:hypothetical protein